MNFDSVTGNVGVPTIETLTLEFLFDRGHLTLGVERGDQGEGEPTPSCPGQLGVELAVGHTYGCDLIQTPVRHSQR